MVEAALAAVVGVWHTEVVVFLAETHEGADLAMERFAVIEALDIGEVRLVHGDDEVEIFQILGLDLASLAGDGVTLSNERLRHPRVWTRAGVVGDGARRVDDEFRAAACFGDLLAKDDFCRRRATDVAKADEEDAVGSGHGR